jgi:hypothetical protein
MESLGEVFPVLRVAARAERAILRTDRLMAHRQRPQARLAHLQHDDGLAITMPELEKLTQCHRGHYERIDWRPIAERPLAATPARTAAGEAAYREACARVARYNTEILTARRLLEGDAVAAREVITLNTKLAELRASMNALGLAVPEEHRLVAVVEAIEQDDVPYERITPGDLRTARREPFSLAERRQIHLAALCALALRVGAELVGVLTEPELEVVVLVDRPCDERGRPTPRPVLQLLMNADALNRPDWRTSDAITLAAALGARMDWSIEHGFAPVSLTPMAGAPLTLARAG